MQIITVDHRFAYNIGPDHWVSGVTRCPSDFCDSRPDEADISLLVIHNISLPPGEFGGGYVQRFFSGHLPVEVHPYFAEIADLQVSAHCLIERDGRLTQFVPFDRRAWHAGKSRYENRERCNDFSIGIELEGCDDQEYEYVQYLSLAALTCALIKHYTYLEPDRICGHSDIAPGRKTDPGPKFDWQSYQNIVAAKLSVNKF